MIPSEASDLSELGLPLRLPQRVRLAVTSSAPLTVVRPSITSPDSAARFSVLAGAAVDQFSLTTRVPIFDLRRDDEVLVGSQGDGQPLVVRRHGEVIVNFDLGSTRRFEFADSKRPLYTYIPSFNIHVVPEAARRPLSNAVQGLRVAWNASLLEPVETRYRRLPLTGFELATLLLSTVLTEGTSDGGSLFQWPFGKRAAFVSLHDIDTEGFLTRQVHDPLFRVESRHDIRATWFVPTAVLARNPHGVAFLTESGNEVGWHGHKHDHRDHIRPYADRAVDALVCSPLLNGASTPLGMRLPKLMKSNALFQLLEERCPQLRYDTSFLHGIAPYPLWVNGRRSPILEIPTTVPTDIRVNNELLRLPRTRRAAAILDAQIARTRQLVAAGGLISIVTHPEKGLSERPELLEVYDQYLAYVRTLDDVWFTTSGALFSYWTSAGKIVQTVGHDQQRQTAAQDRHSAVSGTGPAA